MTTPAILLILSVASYLFGAIPFGLLVGWSKGIDVRTAGSKNIGATNVGRLLGKKYFWIVFLLDLLKGLLPSAAASGVVGYQAADERTYLLWLLVGFAAIFGHMFSLFLGFKGGKGVSTSLGALLGIWPYFTLPVVSALGVWFIVYKASGYISLASIIGTTCVPLAYIAIGLGRGWPIFHEQMPLLAAAILLSLMIDIKHRANIQRLLAGTENRATK